MSRQSLWVSVLVLLGVGFLAAQLWAPHEESSASFEAPKEKPAEKPMAKKAMVGKCPCCEAMMQMGKGGAGPEGMDESMAARCGMMMRARLSPMDPAAVLALKDKLKLTDEQVGKLEQLIRSTRRAVEGLLTEEQRQKASELPETPRTMMEMHQHMMRKMSGGSPMMEPGGSMTK